MLNFSLLLLCFLDFLVVCAFIYLSLPFNLWKVHFACPKRVKYFFFMKANPKFRITNFFFRKAWKLFATCQKEICMFWKVLPQFSRYLIGLLVSWKIVRCPKILGHRKAAGLLSHILQWMQERMGRKKIKLCQCKSSCKGQLKLQKVLNYINFLCMYITIMFIRYLLNDFLATLPIIFQSNPFFVQSNWNV